MIKLTLYEEPWSGDPAENRNQFLGGSDTGTILGINPYKSPYSLWLEKTGKVKPPDLSDKVAVKVGHLLEEAVAQLYEDETGHKVRESVVSYMCKEYPFLKGHVDRIVIDDDERGLECKTTSSNNKYDYENGDVPPYYYSQCQFYMMMTGRHYWDLATLRDNNQFYVNEIERDEDYIEVMLKKLIEFWNCVQTDCPPDIDGSISTTNSLNTLYEKGNEKKNVSLYKLDDLIEKREEYAQYEKEYKSLKNEADNILKEKLGDNEKGQSKNYIVTWKKTVKQRFSSSKAKEILTPDEYESCLEENESRFFKIIKRQEAEQ